MAVVVTIWLVLLGILIAVLSVKVTPWIGVAAVAAMGYEFWKAWRTDARRKATCLPSKPLSS